MPTKVPQISHAPARRSAHAGLRRRGRVRRPAAIRSLVRSRALRFRPGNRVELFDNGRDGLAAMLRGVNSAKIRYFFKVRFRLSFQPVDATQA